jgi:hypothetical protein
MVCLYGRCNATAGKLSPAWTIWRPGGERAIRPRLQRPQRPFRLLMPDDNWRLAPRYYAASGGDDRARR